MCQMNRTSKAMLLVCALCALAACKSNGIMKRAPAARTTSWADTKCPAGHPDGKTVKQRCVLIKGWANDPNDPTEQSIRGAADACWQQHGKKPGEINELHCARVYVAYRAAEIGGAFPVGDPKRSVLMSLCNSELTHNSDGGGKH